MKIFWSLVVIFFLQGIDFYYNGGRIFEPLGLSLEGVKKGFLWEFITFQFMHGGVVHLLFNLLSLFFFGVALEELIGTRKFLWAYFGSGVAGGVLQILMTALLYPASWNEIDTVGASAGIMGIIAVYAVINPYAAISFWGVFTIRAWWYIVAAGLISLYFTIVPISSVAHAAHLGGILFGIAYAKWFMNSEWSMPKFRIRSQPKPAELVATPSGGVWKKGKQMPDEELPSGDFISKEVDPILDKISAHGIQSLTERERRILEAARAKMAKR